MPGTFPTSPGFSKISRRTRHYNLSSEAINGRTQVRNLGAVRREYTLTFPPMKPATFEPIFDFIELQQGKFGTFSISLPDPSSPGNDFTMTARLNSDVQEYEHDVGDFISYEIDIIEVL